MKIQNLREKQIIDLAKTCLEIYLSYLTKEDIAIIYDVINNLKDNYTDLENKLKPIVQKIWDIELASGNYVIVSWQKYANKKENQPITFATISKKEQIVSFCNLTEGTMYEISYDALIGALPKDAATLIEDKENDYTIGKIGSKAINSYNGATKLITPYQLVQLDANNDYKSKHNELILKTDLIKEIGPFSLDNKR